MEKKTIIKYGVELTVIDDEVIEGDFIHPEERFYFSKSIHIKGRLEVKAYFAVESILIDKSEEVGEWQTVGGSQTVGWSQTVGESQKVGGSQTVGGSQEVKDGIVVGLSITVQGTMTVGKRIFAGVCNWKDISEDERTITCEKLVSGEVCYGKLKELNK